MDDCQRTGWSARLLSKWLTMILLTWLTVQNHQLSLTWLTVLYPTLTVTLTRTTVTLTWLTILLTAQAQTPHNTVILLIQKKIEVRRYNLIKKSLISLRAP